MAFKKSGTHLVIARTEEEAARNVLSYPYSFGEDAEGVAFSRLEGVREKFGEDYDVFIVHTSVAVDETASELLRSSQDNET